MAKKRRTDDKRVFYKGKLTWTDVTLREEDKSDFEEWAKNQDMNALFLELLEDGYQIQLSFDVRSESFLAILKQNYQAHADTGFAMSTRSRDCIELMSMVLYKYLIVLDKSLSGGASPTSSGWG